MILGGYAEFLTCKTKAIGQSPLASEVFMNYSIEEKKGEVKFSFTLSAKEWDEEVNKAYLKNKAKFSLPGFRKGQAPRKMIESMYGAGVFFDDAFNSAFYDSYSKALDEHEEIYPVDEPKVDIESIDDNGVKFSAEVTVKPEVKLGEYKGIKLEKVEYNVTAGDVKAELERMREQASRRVEVEGRAVKDGDIVKLDYSGSVDGVKFDGGTATDQELVIGSKTFIPGFEDQMIGMNIGETKDINVTFPKEYHAADLAGKEAVFTVTVKGITEKQLPELDDAFAKDVSKFDTLAEYKADIKKLLTEQNENRAKVENQNAVIKAVTDNAEVEIPKCMIERELDYIVQDMEQRLNYMYNGIKFDEYLKYTGSSMEQFRKDREEEAKNNVKTRLTVEAIIKAENIEATEKDVDEALEKMAETAKKSLEDYKKGVSAQQINYIKSDILMKKLLDFLAENNVFEKKETAKKETKKSAAKTETAEKTEKKETKKKTTKEEK